MTPNQDEPTDARRREHDRIDDALRRAFVPPPSEQFVTTAERAMSMPRTAPRWPRWLAFVAAAALALVIVTGGDGPRGPAAHDGPALGHLWASAYDDAIERGFGAGSCCESESDLAEMCRKVCGCPLTFREVGDDATLLGCYSGLPIGDSLGVLVQVDGMPVVVFVVPRDADPRPTLATRDDLQLRRRELGDLVLYAVSSQVPERALERFEL